MSEKTLNGMGRCVDCGRAVVTYSQRCGACYRRHLGLPHRALDQAAAAARTGARLMGRGA